MLLETCISLVSNYDGINVFILNLKTVVVISFKLVSTIKTLWRNWSHNRSAMKCTNNNHMYQRINDILMNNDILINMKKDFRNKYERKVYFELLKSIYNLFWTLLFYIKLQVLSYVMIMSQKISCIFIFFFIIKFHVPGIDLLHEPNESKNLHVDCILS